MKKDIYIQLLEYGQKSTDTFNFQQLKRDLGFTKLEEVVVKNYLTVACLNKLHLDALKEPEKATPFLCVELDKTNDFFGLDTKYTINYESSFNYFDYLELKEARETSVSARRLAIVAVIVSILGLFSTLFVALFLTQNVEIHQGQFQELKALLSR